jgi:predicted small secreted protein
MKKMILSMLVFSTIVTLIGCEASKGAGKDIENTGKNVQSTVDRNQ